MIYFSLSLLLTFLLTQKNLNFFKNNFASIPNNRSMHFSPKPNGGGIIFAVITSLFGMLTNYYQPLLCLPLSFLGLLDDKYNIKPLRKFIFQISSVILLFLTSGYTFLDFKYEFSILKIIFILIFLIFSVGIINLFNFMDGIDGLLAGSIITILIFIMIKYNFLFLLPFLGSLIGFLIFNWYPSKIFMGDAGSLFIGIMYISILISLPNRFEMIKVLILSFPIIGDAIICLFRRYIAKKDIFKAHKDHLYQRLIANGMKHSNVSFIYILSIAILGIFFLLDNNFIILISLITSIGFGIYLEKYKALRFE